MTDLKEDSAPWREAESLTANVSGADSSTLSVPVITQDMSTLTAALSYARAGWYVGPLKRGTKHPGSVLGSGWQTRTSRDPHEIAAWFSGTDHGVFLHCGRSRALVFDIDHPEAVPPVLAEAIAAASPPAQSTRRGEVARRHVVFRMPPGRMIGNSLGTLPKGWGETRGANGIVVVAPSEHERAAQGGLYHWLSAGPVPVLPETLSVCLPSASPGAEVADEQEVREFLGKHTDAARPVLRGKPVDGFAREVAGGGSRHDAAVVAACWLAREARAGLYPARDAFAALYEAFSAAVADDPRRPVASEWKRIVGWAVSQAQTDDAAATRARVLDPFGASDGLAFDPGTADAGDDDWIDDRDILLTPYLDGTYTPPMPTVGAERDDNIKLLYPGLWHTAIGLTTSGKSWFGLFHATEVMRQGGLVVYLHFEEVNPGGTLDRLRCLAVAQGQIEKNFKWWDCDKPWPAGRIERSLSKLDRVPDLVIMDGINAACSKHGWDVTQTPAVTEYRDRLVTPFAKLGSAVLSLGHPPKAVGRQGERHGFGSTAWLDEVTGVGFRLVSSRKNPIRRGSFGSSSLYSVKDRNGQVERYGQYQDSGDGGWYYMGAMCVDDSPGRMNLVMRLSAPQKDASGQPADSIDILCGQIEEYLAANGGSFEGQKNLQDALRAAKCQFKTGDLGTALARMCQLGRIDLTQGARGRLSGSLRPAEGAPDDRFLDLEREIDSDLDD